MVQSPDYISVQTNPLHSTFVLYLCYISQDESLGLFLKVTYIVDIVF